MADFKYNVGDKVHVHVRNTNDTWVGTVLKRNDTGGGLEYEVSNAPEIVPGFPLLAWESELSDAE